MIDTFKELLNDLCKELLNDLCKEFGTDNEVVLKVSQYLDKLIVSEQRKRLNEIKGN